MSADLRLVLVTWIPIAVIWGVPWLARVVRERLARKVARQVMLGGTWENRARNLADSCEQAKRCAECNGTGRCRHCSGVGWSP